MRNTKTLLLSRGLAIALTFVMVACVFLPGLLRVKATENSGSQPTQDSVYSFTVGQSAPGATVNVTKDCTYALNGSTGSCNPSLTSESWSSHYADKTNCIVYRYAIESSDVVDVVYDAYFLGQLKLDVYVGADVENVSDLSEVEWVNLYDHGSAGRISTPTAFMSLKPGIEKALNDYVKGRIATDPDTAKCLYIRVGDSAPTDGNGGGVARFANGRVHATTMRICYGSIEKRAQSFVVGTNYVSSNIRAFSDCPDYVLNGSTGYCNATVHYNDKTNFTVYAYRIFAPEDVKGLTYTAWFNNELKLEAYVGAGYRTVTDLNNASPEWQTIYDGGATRLTTNTSAAKLGISSGLESYVLSSLQGATATDPLYLYIRVSDSKPDDGWGGALCRFQPGDSTNPVETVLELSYRTLTHNEYSFTVGQSYDANASLKMTTLADDCAYVLNGSNGSVSDRATMLGAADWASHFADKSQTIVYAYNLEHTTLIKKVVYHATFAGRLLLDAYVGPAVSSVSELPEDAAWQELYRWTGSGAGEGANGLSNRRTPSSSLGFDDVLNSYVLERIAESSANRCLYLRVRDASESGYGGSVMRYNSAGEATPTTLKLVYVTPEECMAANGGTHPDADKNCVCDICETARHTYVADCADTCTVCGATRTPTAEHTWGAWEQADGGKAHAHTCKVCGQTESVAHSTASGAYVCDGTQHYQICDTCRLKYNVGNHFAYWYNSVAGGHTYRQCRLCDYNSDKINPHKWHLDGMNGENYLFRCSFCGATTEVAPADIVTDKIVLCDTLDINDIVSMSTGAKTELRRVVLSAPVDARLMRFVEFDLWIDNATLAQQLSSATFTVELTSSGKNDVQEDHYEGTFGTLTAGWNHISIPISSFQMADPTYQKDEKYLSTEVLNFFRVFVNATGEDVSGKACVANVTLTADTAGHKSTVLVINGNSEQLYLTDDHSRMTDISRNESHIRYTDGDAWYDYKYTLTTPEKIRALTWTADFSNKVQVQVFVTDSETAPDRNAEGWVTVYDDNSTGNHGLQVLDLYAKIGDKLTAETKYLYVKISNNPANVNKSGVYQGWGGGATWDNGYTVTLDAVYNKTTLISLDGYTGNTGDIWTNLAVTTGDKVTSPVPDGDGVWKKTGVCVLDSAFDSGVIEVSNGEVQIIGDVNSHVKFLNVSVDGDIGLKFYLMLSQDVAYHPENYALKFVGADGTVLETRALNTILLADALQAEGTAAAGTYMFRYSLAAAEMTKEISVQIVRADGTAQGNRSTAYSVKYYAEKMYELESTDANTKQLLWSLLQYGAAAQVYFNESTDNLANNSTVIANDAYTASTVAAAQNAVSGYTNAQVGEYDVVGIKASSYKLYLQSETVMAVTFTVKDAGDTFTFTCGEDTLPYEIKDGKYVVYLPNISAPNMKTSYTIVATNGTKGQTYQFTTSVLSYVRTALGRELTEAESKLYAALYDYYAAANAKFTASN